MKREVRKHPHITARQLNRLISHLLRDVVIRWIQESCQKHLCHPLPFHTKVTPPDSPLPHAQLDLANQYKHWTTEDWRKLMWSDVSSFQYEAKPYKKFRRPSISLLDTHYLYATVKYPDSVVVWCAFTSAMDKSGLYMLLNKTTMNVDCYT